MQIAEKLKTEPREVSAAIYVTDRELAARYGVSRPTVWRWAKGVDFPAPVSLSPGCTRWRIADIEAWEAAR